MQKKKLKGVRVGWGGQGGCERRIEVIVKMKKKSGGGVRGGVGSEGQCGCEIEAIVKNEKKSQGGGVGPGMTWGGVGRSVWM